MPMTIHVAGYHAIVITWSEPVLVRTETQYWPISPTQLTDRLICPISHIRKSVPAVGASHICLHPESWSSRRRRALTLAPLRRMDLVSCGIPANRLLSMPGDVVLDVSTASALIYNTQSSLACTSHVPAHIEVRGSYDIDVVPRDG
ncbi:NAD-dependent alcohol dehydrogenase [Fusarium oxysporum f. sp. albedinis]|nr:NAD-dependent alcohol dehydrogenase [Fusarium oxysporum f. sp. albedinis]